METLPQHLCDCPTSSNDDLQSLTLSMLEKKSADDNLIYIPYFTKKIGFEISCKLSPLETICMNGQILFSGQHKKTRGPWWSYIAHLSKQICIFTVEVSAKFTGFLYKFYSTINTRPPPPTHPPPPPPAHHHTPVHVFNASWRLELNLKRGSHFCQVILKLVQWLKVFYIAIKPYP